MGFAGRDENPRFGELGRIRQCIESVFDIFKGHLSLEQHGGRTLEGVYARVGARSLVLAAGIWHNWRVNAPRQRTPETLTGRLRPLHQI
jgi:hypothetical protein